MKVGAFPTVRNAIQHGKQTSGVFFTNVKTGVSENIYILEYFVSQYSIDAIL